MKFAPVKNLPRLPLQGIWKRALHPKYAGNPLATAHTPTHASRFNPGTPADPSFELLYLAEDDAVARFEVQALLDLPIPEPSRYRTRPAVHGGSSMWK